MAAPVEVTFNLDISQGDALEKMLAQLTALAKQFDGAVKFRAHVGGGVGGGAAGGAGGNNALIGRLIKGIPGGGMGMAFKNLGLIGGLLTVALGIQAFVKKIFSSSRILGTISSTFFRAAGAMVDIMLMPILPLMVKALIWFIQHGFPLAARIGKWLGDIAAAIAKIVSGIKNIFGGVMSGDFGQVWTGLKQVLGGFWDLVKKVGPFILNALTGGLFSLAKSVGLKVWSVLKEAFGTGNIFKGILTILKAGGNLLLDILTPLPLKLAMKFGPALWEALKTAFSAGKDFFFKIAKELGDVLAGLSGIWLSIGKSIGKAMLSVAISAPKSLINRAAESPLGAPGRFFGGLFGGSSPQGTNQSLFSPNIAGAGGGGGGTTIGTFQLNAIIQDLQIPLEVSEQIGQAAADETLSQIEQLLGDSISLRSV